MTMLIKGGLIQTMTKQGAFTGDILICGDRIAAIGPHIDPPETSSCTLDAHGLTILPGLIDVHVHDGPETNDALLHDSQSSGVTSALLWPEVEDSCRLLAPDGQHDTPIHMIRPNHYTDAQLHDCFITLANAGKRPACEIINAQTCRRILQLVHSTHVKAILVHLSGCEDMLEAVGLSGSPVVIGISRDRTSSPWAMASRLDELGSPVAVTCNHPDAKLRHLPLCAALCVREGMDRTRALQTITTAPAALLGLSDAGRIAPGCRADLAIYDGDPLLLATSHVMTIAGGKILH